ncbi:hypothetical protein TURU_066560 [Turdus rufiventris]|nr:hypothetical protein TURU_066560 [Turdus rufiventris]
MAASFSARGRGTTCPPPAHVVQGLFALKGVDSSSQFDVISKSTEYVFDSHIQGFNEDIKKELGLEWSLLELH